MFFSHFNEKKHLGNEWVMDRAAVIRSVLSTKVLKALLWEEDSNVIGDVADQKPTLSPF